MLASVSRCFQSDARDALSGGLGVGDEDVASLLLLVVDERQDIQAAKLGENRVGPNLCERVAFDQRPERLELREHLEVLIGGKLERPVSVSFQADRKLRLRDFVDDLDVLLALLRAVKSL